MTTTTAVEVIKNAKLDWNVEALPLFRGEGVKQAPISSHKAIVRSDNQSMLGIVGTGYTIVQNNAAFGWFDNVVQSGKAEYVGAGYFGNGHSVWIKARVGNAEVAKGDIVSWELLLTNAHDGSGACRTRLVPLRLVCTNGLVAVDTESQTTVSIRHTKNALVSLNAATEVLQHAQLQIEATRQVYVAMAKAQVTAEQTKRVIEAVFAQERRQELVLDLFEGQGVGLDLEGVRGTAWGLYNAMTEAVDHHLINTSDADKHLERIMVGTGAQLKGKALNVIRELVLA